MDNDGMRPVFLTAKWQRLAMFNFAGWKFRRGRIAGRRSPGTAHQT